MHACSQHNDVTRIVNTMVPLCGLVGFLQTLDMSHNTSSQAGHCFPASSSSEAYFGAAAENHVQKSCGLVVAVEPDMVP